jgi:hypothetical protein
MYFANKIVCLQLDSNMAPFNQNSTEQKITEE